MDKWTFISIWILLSFPIVHNVNSKMKAAGEDIVNKIGFQIYLFIRAQLEVPRFYFMAFLYLITPKHK
ncbi:MAG: hypothetical protein RLZZ196_1369 [Bacteroidota bacterium]|jgi:hypothetical protein